MILFVFWLGLNIRKLLFLLGSSADLVGRIRFAVKVRLGQFFNDRRLLHFALVETAFLLLGHIQSFYFVLPTIAHSLVGGSLSLPAIFEMVRLLSLHNFPPICIVIGCRFGGLLSVLILNNALQLHIFDQELLVIFS